jgi:hypothetical protein
MFIIVVIYFFPAHSHFILFFRLSNKSIGSIKSIKNNVLNVQYKNKQDIDSVKNSFMTYDKMLKFNNDIIDLFDNLKNSIKGEWAGEK